MLAWEIKIENVRTKTRTETVSAIVSFQVSLIRTEKPNLKSLIPYLKKEDHLCCRSERNLDRVNIPALKT